MCASCEKFHCDLEKFTIQEMTKIAIILNILGDCLKTYYLGQNQF